MALEEPHLLETVPAPGTVPGITSVERQRPIAEVLIEPAVGLHERLLDQVGRVEPRRELAVEPQADRPPAALQEKKNDQQDGMQSNGPHATTWGNY